MRGAESNLCPYRDLLQTILFLLGNLPIPAPGPRRGPVSARINITEDNPLHIKTANCPYISEISGDTISLVGKCAWTDGEDDIFTDFHTTFPASKGVADGAQTFTGGSGKFSGIQGSNPFQCRLAGKEGQFLCTQSWTYELTK